MKFIDEVKQIRSEVSRFQPANDAVHNAKMMRGMMLGLIDAILKEAGEYEAPARPIEAPRREEIRNEAPLPQPPPGVVFQEKPIMRVGPPADAGLPGANGQVQVIAAGAPQPMVVDGASAEVRQIEPGEAAAQRAGDFAGADVEVVPTVEPPRVEVIPPDSKDERRPPRRGGQQDRR